jgi:ubiquinone/menaquinone biosynthesis C-methylase UbiE
MIHEQSPSYEWQQSGSTQMIYLDRVSALQAIQEYKHRSFALLNIQAGYHVLDVGCGTGDDVRILATHVGATGRVVGVDMSAAMIREAQQRTNQIDLPVEFHQGDAHNLPFETASFDCCRADRVLQHLSHPRQALAELVRVAKPGGMILVSEPDWETLVIDAGDRQTTRLITTFICDHEIRNGWIGRQLPRLCKEVGLLDIAVDTRTLIITEYIVAEQVWGLERYVVQAKQAGVLAEDSATAWLADLKQASTEQRLFTALTGFGVLGHKSEQ